MAEKSRASGTPKTPRQDHARKRLREHAALYYLGRYASSSANLRRVLMRKVERAAAAHGADPAEGAKLVEDLIARYLALRADRRPRLCRAKGGEPAPPRRLALRHHAASCAQKGVEGELIDDALQGWKSRARRQRTCRGLRAGAPPAARALPRRRASASPCATRIWRPRPRRLRLRGGAARAGRARHRGGRGAGARRGRRLSRITSFSGRSGRRRFIRQDDRRQQIAAHRDAVLVEGLLHAPVEFAADRRIAAAALRLEPGAG